MQNNLGWGKVKTLNRRQMLKLGLISVGVGGVAVALQTQVQKHQGVIRVPPTEEHPGSDRAEFNPMTIVRDFDWGQVTHENGRVVREFHIVAGTSTIQLNSAVSFVTWNYNGRVPGPTLRAKAGDRLRVVFHNQGGHAHTMHFHGIHPAAVDGVQPVRHNNTTTYEFDAEPFGVHLYHCHIPPVTRHINKGLYGMLIIDPPGGRPPADELVLVMAGYDTNDDQRNEFYAFNALPNYFHHHPIRIYQNQLTRVYLLNAIEFDAAVTFHLHANFFQVYPTGMTLQPTQESDVITMGTMERHILEFRYRYPGQYMFHPHQDAIAESGCMGTFDVISNT